MNKEKHTYPKAADLHRLFLGTLLNLLLSKLPQGSALDSQEKSKTGQERLDVEGAGLKNGEGLKGMGGGGHTQYM